MGHASSRVFSYDFLAFPLTESFHRPDGTKRAPDPEVPPIRTTTMTTLLQDPTVEALGTAPGPGPRTAWFRHGVAWLPRIALIVATTSVLLLLWQVGVLHVIDAIARVGWGMIVLVLLPAVGLAMHTFGWAVLLPDHLRPRPLEAFSIYVASQAGNELGGGVLGEPLKLASAPSKHRAEATAVLIVDNATALASTLAFGALALVLVTPPDIALPVAPLTIATFVLLTCVAAALLGRRLLPRVGDRISGCVQRLRVSLVALLRRSPGKVAASFLAHALGKSWIVVEFAVALAFVRDVPIDLSLALGPASVLATIVGAPIPARVGVMEASALWAAQGQAAFFPSLMAIVLLRRVRGCLWTALGIYLTPRCIRLSGVTEQRP